MTTAVEVVLWLIAGIAALPALVVAAQCVVAVLFGPPREAESRGQRPRIAVLIPAHDEAGVIRRTLATVRPQLREGDRLIVVADNCSDGTADEAAAGGAEVVTRQDAERRGKGYALAAGVDHLRAAPPAVLVAIDADCTVEAGAINALAIAAARTGQVQQAIFLMLPPTGRDADARSVVSAFAFMVKNLARPLGMHRLGLPVPLTGSGMAFPWAVIADARLASGDLVEDLSLGLDVAARGRGPRLCPAARVVSTLPDSGAAAAKQRTRWEHGYLQTLLARVPGLLAMSVASRRPTLLLVTLDLVVPPLSLLVSLAAAALVVCVLGGWWVGASGPAALLAGALAALAVALLAAWARFARTDLDLPLAAMLTIPRYIAWKAPIYFNFIRSRETQWVRTQRSASMKKI